MTAAARDAASVRRRFPTATPLPIDLNHMTAADFWRPLLVGIDAVVNCAGILQQRRGQSIAAIHGDAPIALFQACAALRIRRVVQVSAVSAEDGADTDYARTKKAADDHLRGLDLDWVVLRPSLVYGRGSYGGTSFIRSIAGLPFVTPLIGSGDQAFTPIHVDDLATTVLLAVEGRLTRQTEDPCGPQTLTLAQIVTATRAWLDLPPARQVRVPEPLVRAIARLGDLIPLGPVNSTALRQLEYGNAADPEAFARAVGFTPRAMSAAFSAEPSLVQDRWHARLYFLRPLLILVLFLTWLVSGLVGLVAPPPTVAGVVAGLGLLPTIAPALHIVACLADLALALSVLMTPARWSWVSAAAQVTVVSGYSVALTIAAPSLWVDPFGPLLKNVAVLATIGAWAALRDDR